MNDGPAKRCPACRHLRPRPRPQDLRQLRCADDSVTAVAVARIPRGPSDRADAGPHVMPRTGDRRPGPGLRVLAKFVENGVCVVRSRAGRRPRRSRPGRPDRDEHAGRRARRAAHDSDRGHRVRPGAGATLRRGAARVCVVVSAWSRLAPTTARPPARRAEAVRPGPPPEPNVPNVPGPTRRRSRHRQDVVHPLTRNTTGMPAVAAQASS